MKLILSRAHAQNSNLSSSYEKEENCHVYSMANHEKADNIHGNEAGLIYLPSAADEMSASPVAPKSNYLFR